MIIWHTTSGETFSAPSKDASLVTDENGTTWRLEATTADEFVHSCCAVNGWTIASVEGEDDDERSCVA